MTDPRLPGPSTRRQSHARFRCPVCARFVTANAHGVCPRCAYAPPGAIRAAPSPEPAAWHRARDQARAVGVGSSYWGWVALFALLVGILSAALALDLF